VPELPEVETIRRDLLPLLRGRTVRAAWISANAPRLVQWLPPDDFCRGLTGRRITDITRRGKYLLIHLDSDAPPLRSRERGTGGGLTWIVHLRMTGRLQFAPDTCPDDPYLRAKFELDSGAWLCFIDVRKFGTMWLVDDADLVTGKLGPEPLDEAFDIAAFHTLLKRRAAAIKAVLLDQAVLAGVGNIYADESLFRAKIDPRKPANRISRPAAARLHHAIVEVLEEAVGDRGSSFRDYADARGEAGYHHLKVRVFRRTEEPCFVCGTPIRRVKVAGRSTHFCPACQKR
jgi:formamidopyrimidine-DNA glycosylase